MKKFLIVYLLLISNSIISFGFVKSDSIIRPQPRSSQVIISSLNTPSCYLKATYGQPLKKNRLVFGGLVQYDRIWRTGANEATELTFTNDVIFAGMPLKAGTYTLFTKPNQKQWKIYLNSVLGQWGDFAYDSTKNVIDIGIASLKSENIYEGFTIAFVNKEKTVDMNLYWDDVKITIPIQSVDAVIPEKKKKKKWFNS